MKMHAQRPVIMDGCSVVNANCWQHCRKHCICCAQGTALDEVLAFFPAMLAAGSSSATFDSMLPALLAAGNAPDTSKTAQHNIARCIASLTGRTSQQQANAVVKGLLLQLQVRPATSFPSSSHPAAQIV